MGSSTGISNPKFSNQDWQTVAQGSELLPTDLSSYAEFSTNRYISAGWSKGFSILLGLKMTPKEGSSKKSPSTLRIGASVLETPKNWKYYSKESFTPWDTLTSAQTGAQYFIDSVNAEYYSVWTTGTELRLDASYLKQLVKIGRLTLQGGLNISGGISLQNRTEITRIVDAYTQVVNQANPARNYFNYFPEYSPPIRSIETLKHNVSFSGSVTVPIQVDLPLAKEIKKLNRIHLIYEFRPGMNYAKIPELSYNATLSLQHNLGVKLSLNNPG